MSRALLLTGIFAMALPGACQQLKAFSYPDTKTALENWEPQFGSKPVRVDTLDNGETCLALDADFQQEGDRACWDWLAPLDLSQVGRIAFDVSATGGGLAGNIGIYFGTPNDGWYAKFWGGVSDRWVTRIFRPGDFGVEGEPEGWDKVDRFRFSVWSNGAGEATFRLRNLRTLPADPAENCLKNGSFEIESGGMPYAWGSGHWGVGDLPWATNMALWRDHWRLDTDVAHHGRASLQLDNVADLPLLKAYSVWVTPPNSAETCVLSAWLKSDQEKLPVTLQCGSQSITVDVGRDWSQSALAEIPSGERMTAVIAPQAPGKLWIDAAQLQKCEQATSEFHPSFDDPAIAAREALVDWSPPQRTPDIAAGRSVHGPLSPATAGIDGDGRFLLNGQPYIQHSLGLEFISDLDILDFVAESGFKETCIQVRPSVSPERLRAIFDRCASVGVRVIPWLDGNMSRQQFAQYINMLKDHPALLCWYVYDEPSGERFAEADARVTLAKELDPSRPAYINYLSNKLQDQTGDIYSTDVYPIPRGTPLGAVSAVRRMKAAAELERKPVWMWLQGTGYAYWMDREPTPRELSCMAYGSLIAGARGIYYFAQIPRTKQCFDEMRALCVELDVVAPAVYSLEKAPDVSCDQANILCKAYAYKGHVWVIAVNTQTAPCRARLTLPGTAGEAEVMFEGRRVGIADASWEDQFGPYERHVYRPLPRE